MKSQHIIDVEEIIKSDERALNSMKRYRDIKPVPDVPEKKEELTKKDKMRMRSEALAIVKQLNTELEIIEPPKFTKPNTWMMYSVSELARGDAMQIDGAIYIYLKKLAWWRNKTANILIAQHHNPDAQKRVGELDFVYGFKGYIQHQQLSKMGVEL